MEPYEKLHNELLVEIDLERLYLQKLIETFKNQNENWYSHQQYRLSAIDEFKKHDTLVMDGRFASNNFEESTPQKWNLLYIFLVDKMDDKKILKNGTSEAFAWIFNQMAKFEKKLIQKSQMEK